VNSKEQVRAQLERFAREGTLAGTACSKALRTRLLPLLASGIVAEERAGAGRRFVLADRQAFARFLARQFPAADLPGPALSRVTGLGRFRDSKAYSSDTPEIVAVRAARDVLLDPDGQPVAAAAATAHHGVFAFLLSAGSRYRLEGPTALIENPALFTQWERLGLPVGLALYSQGKISGRLLDWLVRQTASRFTLLHLPDYDPAGLVEHERLCRRLGSRVELYWPEDLEARFHRYANRWLLDRPRQRAALARLRAAASPAVRAVVALIDRSNGGLEQEALLLPAGIA